MARTVRNPATDLVIFCRMVSVTFRPSLCPHCVDVYLWKFPLSPRTREAHGGDRERGGEAEREGEEDPEASDHLLQPAAPGAQPALSADPVPRPAREGRPGSQTGPDADPGTVVANTHTHTKKDTK